VAVRGSPHAAGADLNGVRAGVRSPHTSRDRGARQRLMGAAGGGERRSGLRMGGDDRSWERVAAAAREGEVLWGRRVRGG
jgi:hypothetical protein